MSNLNARAWTALALLGGVMGVLLFVPAGSVRYWQAWVYLSVFIGASALVTLYLARRDPSLLERRMRGGPLAEKRPAQKLIMLGASIGFVALLVVPALDYRFGRSAVPLGAVVAGNALVAIGFLAIFLVYRENTFTAATIQLAEGQRVTSTGPYAIVRHPMYAGFAAVAALLPFLIWRLVDEERFLVAGLPGYAEYQRQVRYRLVPFVW